ncbi:putative RNA-directed DNA polymerase from transposon X-element [Penaeus vannamei]|uniref:Putative RNA-directed DNA polymerase from transposon X-element n=1 Tax=Penaeus vannamei TaxID=6689 RepID=A0A423SD88_PENVA|nr:putative RNA-directed DNA polymerase from transposon X-element [Penaeus vannamei]
MLMGSNRQTVSYIYNAHRQRVNSVEGMEALHREFWQQNFQISPAENARFDNTTETEVTNYLHQHRNLTLPENIITLNNLTEDSPLSTPITPEEIINTIKHTKNTTPGASNINKTIIEHLPPTMIRKLRHIFNACLATGYFPDKFKHATITLIAKSGKSAHEVGNYRPISLLEVPGKLLERLITRRLITHLENNNKHNSRQYGFRPHRRTESAIALAYEEIALSLANKHQINIILRDVSKAFDKVWHDGLKYKIIQLQLPTHLTRLLCSFLDHRTATIRLGSHLGTPLHLRSGVPKGSVLLPTLYILYTANLPQPTPCKTLHRIYNIEPLNTRIHRRAQNTWTRLREQEDANYHNNIDRHTNIRKRANFDSASLSWRYLAGERGLASLPWLKGIFRVEVTTTPSFNPPPALRSPYFLPL